MKQKVVYNVIGLVQGVGYRFFVREQARIFKLFGYAKNLYDGSVEVSVEIETEQILLFRDILKTNCTRAIVNNVAYIIDDNLSNYRDFRTF